MSLVARLRGLLAVRPRASRPDPDPITMRLRAAVEADLHAKTRAAETHEHRVHAMIDDLFLNMDRRDARR